MRILLVILNVHIRVQSNIILIKVLVLDDLIYGMRTNMALVFFLFVFVQKGRRKLV